MWQELLRAFAIVLVLEGILPFMSPMSWKRFVQQMLSVPNHALRVAGLGMMLAGVALLYLLS
ncbi:MAG: DUF2065 family protein [Gammaproteobacteria bacterium]|nr:DUF2065 family protein [Gammaproteobacteria bacterium]